MEQTKEEEEEEVEAFPMRLIRRMCIQQEWIALSRV